MPKVTVTQRIDAPIAKVWQAWDDYGGIARFNPNLNRSFLLEGSQSTGLGATRQCDLSDGKNYIQEKVIDYVPERRMAIDIYNGTMPLKSAQAEIDLLPLGAERTEVRMTMTFVPKMGLLGRLLVPLMKPQFRKLLGKLLQGNKDFVEQGREVMRTV